MAVLGLLGLLVAAAASPDGGHYTPDFLMGDFPRLSHGVQWDLRPTRDQIRQITPAAIASKTAVTYHCDVDHTGVLHGCAIKLMFPTGVDFSATIAPVEKMFTIKRRYLDDSFAGSVDFTIGYATDAQGHDSPAKGCFEPFCVGIPMAPH